MNDDHLAAGFVGALPPARPESQLCANCGSSPDRGDGDAPRLPPAAGSMPPDAHAASAFSLRKSASASASNHPRNVSIFGSVDVAFGQTIQ